MPGFAGIGLALAVLGAQPQSIQSTPQGPTATVLEDVVVNGRPLREAIDAFVDEVTDPPRGRGPARWDRNVCVGTVNLRRDAAQALNDRVSEIAGSIGLEPGEPGCQANILIIATDDAAALTSALTRARPRAFRPGYSGASQSREALESFRTSNKPVRWWPVSVPVDRNTGQVAVRLPGQAPPVIEGRGLTRTSVTNRLLRTFVIVDMGQLQNISYRQLGDFIAMVSLAQIDPDADATGFQTVLNLFSNREGGLVLTDWDYAYLRALYDAELNARAPNGQLGEVGSIMERDRRNPDRSPETP